MTSDDAEEMEAPVRPKKAPAAKPVSEGAVSTPKRRTLVSEQSLGSQTAMFGADEEE